MRSVGTVIRLQVQTASLKKGERPWRVYDPSPLRTMARLRLTPEGAVGIAEDGTEHVDVHHWKHATTKAESGREASFGFSSHYAKMRGEYGDRIATGCAGENVLVETDRIWRLEDFARGLAFQGADGDLAPLDAVIVAEPCVEFSRFSLGNPQAPPPEVKPVLQFLGEGTRGYCFTPRRESTLSPGDRLIVLD
ncbi:MAG TPA: hypothetical protein VH854_04465 [Thermoanaerobaculia bacterium]|nr:hypothetical protein [Thermoanaerobaculia bacterium]